MVKFYTKIEALLHHMDQIMKQFMIYILVCHILVSFVILMFDHQVLQKSNRGDHVLWMFIHDMDEPNWHDAICLLVLYLYCVLFALGVYLIIFCSR